jgi:hypothetical protein
MGWIIGGIVVLVLIILIIVLVATRSGESGGQDQYGQKPHFFTPINERRGIQGERTINYYLRELIKEDEYLLTNILLPLRNGHKTEIDSILITRKGIFCIEVKNWVGHISGDDESEYWHQSYDDPYMSDRDHRNPVKQNENHCAVLERKLDNDYLVKNIVLFPEIEDRTNLYSSSTYEIGEFVRHYQSLPDEIYPEDLEEIFNKLSCYQATEEELEAHKQEVRKSHGNN